MLLLDEEGFIIGWNLEEDAKPAPFPIAGARWNGKGWEYPDWDEGIAPERAEPPLEAAREVNAFDIQCAAHTIIRPVCGTYKKAKSDEISALIPSFGKAEWVAEAVQSALGQTLAPSKVIVLAMTDEDFSAASAVKSPLLEVVRSERLNASAARNRLAEMCPTEYFVFLDADDLLAPNYFEAVRKAEASVVAAPFKKDAGAGWRVSRFSAASLNVTALLCKEVWSEVGGLREDLAAGGEDSYFWNEIFRQKKWLVDWTDETWLDYRKVDGGSLTARTAEFVLSKERELCLHSEWYRQRLEASVDPARNICLKALGRFLEAYGGGNETGAPLKIKVKAFYPENAMAAARARRWNKARALFKESRTRETECVCMDESAPLLYGRKFDLYVFAAPSLNWERISGCAGMDENSCYVNNPKVDLSRPVDELLKEFCVVFSEHPIARTAEPSDGALEREAEKISLSVKEEMLSEGLSLQADVYTFSFFSRCDKKCAYCSQKGMDTNLGEDELLENFSEMADRLDELHGMHWRPQFMGGEITLCSESFARRLMERIGGREAIIVTNGREYGRHAFYSYPNVRAYVHLTEPPFDDSFLRPYDSSNIVVNKADLPAILEAVERKSLRKNCDFSLYVGTDGRFAMDGKSLAALDSALEANGYPKISPRVSGSRDRCSVKAWLVRQANAYDKTIVPCCGIAEPPIPIEEWRGQPPSGKACKGCTITAY